MNETTRKPRKKKSVKARAKTKKKYVHHPDHYNTSENFLIKALSEDLKEAWQKIRESGANLGEQRIYASGKAIMFSKKVCYFFVRPQKKYLEVVIFLKNKMVSENFKIKSVSKTKFAHTFRLIHADQVEGELVQALEQAYFQS